MGESGRKGGLGRVEVCRRTRKGSSETDRGVADPNSWKLERRSDLRSSEQISRMGGWERGVCCTRPENFLIDWPFRAAQVCRCIVLGVCDTGYM